MTEVHKQQTSMPGESDAATDGSDLSQAVSGGRAVPGKRRGIHLKIYNDHHRGFRELVGDALPDPAEDLSPGSSAGEPVAAESNQTLARVVRKELEAALRLLDEALAELAATDRETEKT